MASKSYFYIFIIFIMHYQIAITCYCEAIKNGNGSIKWRHVDHSGQRLSTNYSIRCDTQLHKHQKLKLQKQNAIYRYLRVGGKLIVTNAQNEIFNEKFTSVAGNIHRFFKFRRKKWISFEIYICCDHFQSFACLLIAKCAFLHRNFECIYSYGCF